MSTLVDKIVQAIRGDIYNGTLPPGSPLKQVELANRYGVSPIPLREALQRLQVEGVVEYFAYRGAIVARIRLAEAQDVADIRHALESLAYRAAIPLLDEEQLDRLLTINGVLDTPETFEHAEVFLESICEFYSVLLSKADRPLLLEMIHTNLKRASRYYAELRRHTNWRTLEAPSSNAYVSALGARDVEAVIQVMGMRHAAYVGAFTQHLPN